jgi:hypothetical protein
MGGFLPATAITTTIGLSRTSPNKTRKTKSNDWRPVGHTMYSQMTGAGFACGGKCGR